MIMIMMTYPKEEVESKDVQVANSLEMTTNIGLEYCLILDCKDIKDNTCAYLNIKNSEQILKCLLNKNTIRYWQYDFIEKEISVKESGLKWKNTLE